VASTTLVDKLQLKTEPHPHPYSIQWLNQGKRLKVSLRCLVSLSIGKSYVDKLWCDILAMDACHVLLGRPCDRGPSLSVMTTPVNSSPIACKCKLKEVLFQAFEMHSDRADHGQPVANSTGTCTAVPPAVRRPGCTPCRLPGFVLLVS